MKTFNKRTPPEGILNINNKYSNSGNFGRLFKTNCMANYYELKQTTLMELEIAELVAKIQRLEKEIALKEQEIKQLKMLTLALADQ